MAQIPTVPGSTRINTPSVGVMADSGALNAPNRARAALGGAIGDAGQQLGEFAQKLQGAINYGIAADADRKMRQEMADFQISRKGRTDEDQWEGEWKERSNQLWSSLQEYTPMGPALKRQMQQNFLEWQSAGGIEVKMMAQRQAINRATERVNLAVDEAARGGDENGVVNALDGAVRDGLVMPEQAQKLKISSLAKIDEYAAKNYILNNPAGAVAYLEAEKNGKPMNLTRLTPDDRLALLNTAKVQFTKYQSENYADLIEGLQNGEPATPTELQSLVAQKVISPKQRKSYETAYRLGNFNTDANRIGTTFSDITSYDPQDDPKFTKRAELLGRIATSGFPQNVQSEMNQLLGQKSDPKSALNTPVAKDTFAAIDDRFRKGLYGKFENKVVGPDGVTFTTVIDPKIYEKAMAMKSKVEDATRRYLNQNPQATAEDVNRFVSDFQMTAVTKSGRQSVINSLGLPSVKLTPEDRKAQLDAILSKAKK